MSTSKQEKTLVVVIGPTAGGKTSLAIQLAKDLNTEIISADSRQFYREIKIGTATPSADELSQAPHHFIGNLSIHDSYDVHQFEQQALAKINELFKTKDQVVVVGGSGLYINAICEGIDNIPNTPDETRCRLQEIWKNEGIAVLQQMLEEKDPEYFAIVDKENPKRLLRALEVCEVSGKTYTSFRQKNTAPRPFNIVKVGLLWDRQEIVDRIHLRVDQMLDAGLLAEVKSMHQFKHLNALNTVGYKEVFEYLDGNCSFDFAIEKIKTNTRRYAKRQMTWFRKDENTKWLHPSAYQEIIKHIQAE